MSTWRDVILKKFVPHLYPIILVIDPDNLMTEEGILTAIENQGFTVMVYEDPIEFRYVFETQYRLMWDSGELKNLVVIGRSSEFSGTNFPYDLVAVGELTEVTLRELFPHLNYGVVRSLDRKYWDSLYKGGIRANIRSNLSASDTAEFILNAVFGLSSKTIIGIPDLLHFLLQIHYEQLNIPDLVIENLVKKLRQNPVFSSWPLEKLATNRRDFLQFLQTSWEPFLDQLLQELDFQNTSTASESTSRNATVIPFDHEKVRVYVDNLFAERLLQPVPHPQSARLQGEAEWIALGVQDNHQSDVIRRTEKLIELVQQRVPTDMDSYSKWAEFSLLWGTLNMEMNEVLLEGTLSEISIQAYERLTNHVDNVFQRWLMSNYGKLFNQPPSPPVMVHHIPKYLSRQIEDGNRVALIVVDGLSISQWRVLKAIWKSKSQDWRFDEHAVFAWIPTLTSVSRQAIFSGKLPKLFESSIATTNSEGKLWEQFWIDVGLRKSNIAYTKITNPDTLKNIENIISDSRLQIVGLVVDTVDKIMHGGQLGMLGMHSQVKLWATQGDLMQLVSDLIDFGYDVWITSDHGNIEATGIGRPPNEGVLAEQKALRVRVFNDEKLRNNFIERMSGTIEWNSDGLPDTYYCLIPEGRGAFGEQNQKTITHGGISIDEVIVPFVYVGRGDSNE